MKRNKKEFVSKEIEDKLPARCFSTHNITGDPIIINRGVLGFVLLDRKFEDGVTVDDLNKAAGISKAQEAAMFAGSMFGWDTPAANPDNYEEDGSMKKEAGK